MVLKKLCLPLFAVFIVILTFSPVVRAQGTLSDIHDHWAEKPIETLLAKQVICGYPDGSFKPDQPISRAELAKILAKTFGYQAYNLKSQAIADTRGHWSSRYMNAVTQNKIMKTFNDGSFRPENRISRAQLAMMLSRVVHLGTPEEQFPKDISAGFRDVPSGYWAYRYIEIVNQLGLLPANYQTEYHPDMTVTRAEASWAVQALSRISVTKGKISSIDPDSGLINLHDQKNQPLLTLITPETILLRNNTPSSLDSLLTGDEATAITMPTGEVKFFKAFGKVTKNDLLSRISSYTKGHLKPEQINSLISGDWDAVKNDLKGELYDKLVATGLTPSEAESIMVSDWNYLDTLSKDRLAEALSGYFGITREFSQAILERDLSKIKEYGRIELATAALSRLLGTSGDLAQN